MSDEKLTCVWPITGPCKGKIEKINILITPLVSFYVADKYNEI